MWENNPMPYGYAPQNRGWAPAQRQMGYGYNQPQTGNVGWIRVSGPQAVRDVSVPPGGEAWIMEENRPVFHYKQANDMGQTTTKSFRFEEISMEDTSAGPDMSKFATKEDLNAIHERLNRLDKFANDLGGMNT